MSKTALIVDDSPTMRQMVAFTLTNAGFTVVEAEHGVDAVSKASAWRFCQSPFGRMGGNLLAAS